MQHCKCRFIVDRQLLFDVDLNSQRIIILIGVFLVIGISPSPKHLSSFWLRTQLLSEDAIVCDSLKPLAHSNCRVSLYRRPEERLQWEKAQQKALCWPTALHGVLLSSMSSLSKLRGKGLQGKWTSYKPWLVSDLLQVNLLLFMENSLQNSILQAQFVCFSVCHLIWTAVWPPTYIDNGSLLLKFCLILYR